MQLQCVSSHRAGALRSDSSQLGQWKRSQYSPRHTVAFGSSSAACLRSRCRSRCRSVRNSLPHSEHRHCVHCYSATAVRTQHMAVRMQYVCWTLSVGPCQQPTVQQPCLRAGEALLALLVRQQAVVVGMKRTRRRYGHATVEQQLMRSLTRLASCGAIAQQRHVGSACPHGVSFRSV